MTKKEIQQQCMEGLLPLFTRFGYKKKGNGYFIKKDELGESSFHLQTISNYTIYLKDDFHYLYHFTRNYDDVHLILLQMKERLPRNIHSEPANYTFSYRSIENIGTMTPYAVYKGEEVIIDFGDEATMKLAIQKIYTFMEEIALPEMDMYSNIKFLDDTINGEDYWQSGDIRFHKYLSLSNFYDCRLVIAYLCQNSRYKMLFEMLKNKYIKYFEEEENKEDIPKHFYEGRCRLDYLNDLLKEIPPLKLKS